MGKISTVLPPKITSRVDQMVAHQRQYASENSMPFFGFPNSRLYDVHEIAKYAGAWAAREAKKLKVEEYAYQLFYSDDCGVYCEMTYPDKKT